MAIIAEIGLDMTVFGTDGRLVSWAKLCPQTRQSGKKSTAASPGKGDPWLKGPLGEVAVTAARSDTFLGERYRRLARRRGKRKALAVTGGARSLHRAQSPGATSAHLPTATRYRVCRTADPLTLIRRRDREQRPRSTS